MCRGNPNLYIHIRPPPRLAAVPDLAEKDISKELAELLKRALFEAGDLQDIEETEGHREPNVKAYSSCPSLLE